MQTNFSAERDLASTVYDQLKQCAQSYITESQIKFMLNMTNDNPRQTLLMVLGYIIQTLKFNLMYNTGSSQETRETLEACQRQMQQLVGQQQYVRIQ